MSQMSATSHFLHLPDDVLVYLLDLAPMSDLESVSKTCKQLKTICGLVRAPYLYELNHEGLEYNAASASSTVSFSHALASLRCRENRWRTMRPISSSYRSTLNESNFTSYSQNVALYVSRQIASAVVHGDTVEHSTYHGQSNEVTRFHDADVLQDLLVLLRMHIGTGVSYLCFLSLRGMSPHSAAASPTRIILTGISPMGYISAPLHAHGLRILGTWCALLTTVRCSMKPEAQVNTLLLCNWKTNSLIKLAGVHPDNIDDFHFINSRTLAVIHRAASNSSQLVLRLYDVTLPSQISSSGCVRLRLSLRLPLIENHAYILPISRMVLPRASQEQVLQPDQRPHEILSPNSGIMALSIPLGMGTEEARLNIAIDVAMLLSIARGNDISDRTMSWSQWGPKISRVFLTNDVLRAEGDVKPLQDVEGYRIAFSTNIDCGDSQTPISEEHSRPAAFIIDFNPASVRWARQEDKAGRGLRGALVTEPSVLRPGHFFAEEVVSSLPYTRTMLEGYLPQHQIRLSRDEVVYPAHPVQESPLHNVYSFA
ncbi:hypothetical protein DEU56DRAFT_834984 [Suillus clintonianus]|uniref:uncharacterized protein n=1 Tax=Suillus clintonianus TaxID=1904413 RepID=UPI001B85BD51|nr:uncharacterized protein DEU56DRAFT_834984 [Suillus clintonianus]KAG2121238.1 hypothetical protein DEU56DRAFT_834984 [Suillus clintonianus]